MASLADGVTTGAILLSWDHVLICECLLIRETPVPGLSTRFRDLEGLF